jgi:hypothetical protein
MQLLRYGHKAIDFFLGGRRIKGARGRFHLGESENSLPRLTRERTLWVEGVAVLAKEPKRSEA